MGLSNFMASEVCRSVLIPVFGVVFAVVAKWAMRQDSSKEKLWEIFSMGPDLIVVAIVVIPTLMAEKAFTLENVKGNLSEGEIAQLQNFFAIGALIFALVISLAMIEFTYERKVGKSLRQAGGVIKPLFLGVCFPILLGAGALALTLGLVT